MRVLQKMISEVQRPTPTNTHFCHSGVFHSSTTSLFSLLSSPGYIRIDCIKVYAGVIVIAGQSCRVKNQVSKPVPQSTCLFEAIECVVHLAYVCWVFGVHVSGWLLHVYNSLPCLEILIQSQQEGKSEIVLPWSLAGIRCQLQPDGIANSPFDIISHLPDIHAPPTGNHL